jgi:O-antigen ligase
MKFLSLLYYTSLIAFDHQFDGQHSWQNKRSNDIKKVTSFYFSNPLENNTYSLLDKVALLLIFLFPVFGNLIPIWYSAIFFFIAIVSFFYIKKGWPLLDSFQKNMAYALLVYFSIFLINATLLGWQAIEIGELGVELRLIFIIPLLCMASAIPSVRPALYLGLIVSLVIFFGQAFYELVIQQQLRLSGSDNPLRISALALITMSVVIPWLNSNKWHVSSILVYFGSSLIIVLTQGRMAIISTLVVSIILFITIVKQAMHRVIALTVIAVIVIFMFSTTITQGRFSEVEVLFDYVTNEKQYDKNETPGSWVTHYMMLEASWKLLKEHPILGVGSKRYPEHMANFVEAGQVHPVIGHPQYPTPHTLIAEIAVSRGLAGILTFTLFIYMALRLAYNRGKEGIALGMFIVCILLTGVSEAWWVRIGSFVSLLVIFLSVFSTSNTSVKTNARI